jgi:glyoxylase-like metal-dependent hydrolase (beta-lactamase superfamily II)
MILEGFPLWYFDTNCYLLAHEPGGPCIIVDAPPDAPEILRRLEHHRLTPVALLNTHCHVDHTGGDGIVVRETGVDAHIHALDEAEAANPHDVLLRMGLPAGPEFDPPETFAHLEEGQVLDLAGFKLTVRHTPGHTQGSVCFYVPEHDILFSGDHLFKGSVGRTDLPGGSWSMLLQSIREKVLDLPDETIVLPGHGDTTTVGDERRGNPFVHEAIAG